MYNHYKTSLLAPCGGLVYVFFLLFSQALARTKLEFVAPGNLLHLSKLFLQLLVLLHLFVLSLPDVTFSEDYHVYLNCSLLLQVNHSQRLLADGQLTSQVVSMALYAWVAVLTGKRPTNESNFEVN